MLDRRIIGCPNVPPKEIIDSLKLHTLTLGEAYQVATHVAGVIREKIISIGEKAPVNQSGSEPWI